MIALPTLVRVNASEAGEVPAPKTRMGPVRYIHPDIIAVVDEHELGARITTTLSDCSGAQTVLTPLRAKAVLSLIARHREEDFVAALKGQRPALSIHPEMQETRS